MANKTYYEILGVSKRASSDEITAAKNVLAKQYHPDVNMQKGIDTTEQMQEILEAYHTLINPDKRAEYDREISGSHSVMQTFDLYEEGNASTEDSGFVVYWKASNQLYEIICESDALYKEKSNHARLAELALQALKFIFILRDAKIPERYWHPDTMNWLLFASYKNRNYTVPYLLTLYDDHLKKDVSKMNKLKIQNKCLRYQHSVKKLMKY